jgi:phage host-nuclease inhibitor protein Gam
MSEFNDYLAEYEDVYLRLSDMQVEMERARQDAIPPEVREQIETIEAEYQPKLDVLREKLKSLEDEVKERVLNTGSTLKGNVVMAVYRKGSTKWDEKHLERLAAEYPRILEAKVEGKPSVAIQRIK